VSPELTRIYEKPYPRMGDEPPEEWYRHAPLPYEYIQIKCEQCGRKLRRVTTYGPEGEAAPPVVSYEHEPRHGMTLSTGDHNTYRKEQAKAATQKRKAGLREYHGAIALCQAGITTRDRASIHYRCDRKPRYVSTDWQGKPLVVCGTHAREKNVSRFVGHKAIGTMIKAVPPAEEPVEAEHL
jgi:hypothetical protein